MRILASIAALSLGLCPVAARAEDEPPVTLAKTSKWEINYDEDACHLLAKFGEGQETVALKMTQYSLGEAFDLTLFGEPLAWNGSQNRFEAGFMPSPKLESRWANYGTILDKRPLVILRGMRLDNLAPTTSPSWKPGQKYESPSIAPEREAMITGFEFRTVAKGYRLETGSMAGPMQALRTCTQDLIKSWGFDPQVLAGLSNNSEPKNNPGYWATTNDYPIQALSMGKNGLIKFRLDIDEEGTITNCKVLFRTNPDDFSTLTCKLLKKRARMSAALDQNGKPVKSFYLGTVKWVVPQY